MGMGWVWNQEYKQQKDSVSRTFINRNTIKSNENLFITLPDLVNLVKRSKILWCSGSQRVLQEPQSYGKRFQGFHGKQLYIFNKRLVFCQSVVDSTPVDKALANHFTDRY